MTPLTLTSWKYKAEASEIVGIDNHRAKLFRSHSADPRVCVILLAQGTSAVQVLKHPYEPAIPDVRFVMTLQASSSKRGGAKSKKFELTEEQKQEIREAFDLFDTDGSGERNREASAVLGVL